VGILQLFPGGVSLDDHELVRSLVRGTQLVCEGSAGRHEGRA
jgi:hypothetical protein